MNRGIRFRSWNGKDMAYNIVIAGDTTTEEDGEVLMQFTGLLDISGSDIYEGDILKPTYWKKSRHQNRFKVVKWATSVYRRGFNIGTGEFEIIGNVYENPELAPTPNKLKALEKK